MKTALSLFDRLLIALAWVAGVIAVAIVVAICLNVALRNLLGETIYGLFDAIEYGILAMTFLAAPWVLSKNAHVTVDLISRGLPPGQGRVLARVTNLIGCIVALIFLIYAFQAMTMSMSRGSMIRTAFTIPEWWTLSVAPLSFALISVEFLRQAIWPPARPMTETGL
jgi:TRAP-type C4-dicarboxylate transport system permease small subunit